MSASFRPGSTGTSLALVAAMALSACALDRQTQAAKAPVAAVPSGAVAASAEAGRELFDVHCARCHGTLATGTANGPNLLPRVRGMSEPGFVSAVLQRYRFSVPATESSAETGARDAMLRGLMSRQDSSGGMPRWEEQPVVSQGVRSLYLFLSDKAR